LADFRHIIQIAGFHTPARYPALDILTDSAFEKIAINCLRLP
jgi:hypothetical protein